METISKQHFEGERPLFAKHHLRLEQVTIGDGESAIKECSDIEAEDCRFWGKYPFWHVHGFRINRCQFDVGARSALWYSDHLDMRNTRIDGPKMFREMSDLYMENVTINDADETFWRCRNVEARNLELHEGTYPFMFSDNIVNCHLAGEQLLCYADQLVLENCTFDQACDRVFEYSNVEASIRGHIENIKNPISGHVVADSIGSITIDEHVRQPNNCIIETRP